MLFCQFLSCETGKGEKSRGKYLSLWARKYNWHWLESRIAIATKESKGIEARQWSFSSNAYLHTHFDFVKGIKLTISILLSGLWVIGYFPPAPENRKRLKRKTRGCESSIAPCYQLGAAFKCTTYLQSILL